MQRYNLFESPHLALQDALFMGVQSFNKQKEPGTVVSFSFQKLEETVADSLQLIYLIELYVMPAVEHYEPAVVDALRQQHQQARAWAHKLLNAIALPADENLANLYKKFMCAQLQCSIKCEDMLNPVLWFYYTDKELQQLEQHLLQAADYIIQRSAA